MKQEALVTVFTPAYNRANTIHRVYDSLKAQTYKNFEWVIIDDGSTDNTKSVVEKFMAEDNFFDIRYYYQENGGKHIATNSGVQKAKGEFFITFDSDDGCKSNAIERFLEVWDTIPEAERDNYKGVTGRSCDPDMPSKIFGTKLPEPVLDSDDDELRIRYKVKGELWGIARTKVLLENPYPAIEGVRVYPIGAYWGKIGRKYKTRFFDEALRYYYADDTQTTNQITKNKRPKELYLKRTYMLSGFVVSKYFKYNPWYFYKHAIGLVRDGSLNGKSLKDMINDSETSKVGVILILLALIPGKLLKIRYERMQKK